MTGTGKSDGVSPSCCQYYLTQALVPCPGWRIRCSMNSVPKCEMRRCHMSCQLKAEVGNLSTVLPGSKANQPSSGLVPPPIPLGLRMHDACWLKVPVLIASVTSTCRWESKTHVRDGMKVWVDLQGCCYEWSQTPTRALGPHQHGCAQVFEYDWLG